MIHTIFGNTNFCPEKHNENGEIVNKFAKWMEDNDKRQCDVAKKIGISPSSLHEILRLDKIPNIKVAYEIEVYTKGQVTIYDWLDQYASEDKRTITPKTKAKKNHKK